MSLHINGLGHVAIDTLATGFFDRFELVVLIDDGQ